MPSAIAYDGKSKFVWLDANPEDISGPTVAEVVAGAHLTPYIPPDGVKPNMTNARVNGADANSKFNAEGMGRFGVQLSVDMKRRLRTEGNLELAWDTLGDREITGCAVIFPFGLGVVNLDADTYTPAVGEPCYVFPDAETGSPLLPSWAENEEQLFTVELAFGSDADLNAVVAAS